MKDDSKYIPKYWETAADGEKVWNYVQQQEGNVTPKKQNPLSYVWSAGKTFPDMLINYFDLANKNLTDKYKHAYINCSAAQNGKGGADVATGISNVWEWYDVKSKANTIDSSEADQYANKIGRLLGTKYPDEDCDEIVKKYIKKYY